MSYEYNTRKSKDIKFLRNFIVYNLQVMIMNLKPVQNCSVVRLDKYLSLLNASKQIESLYDGVEK